MVNKKLKEIDIDGKLFYYEVKNECGGYCWSWTNFYTTNNLFKTFSIFGVKLYNYNNNKYAFRVDFNIEDCSNTKEYVREEIIKEMRRNQHLQDRCNEIKNGNII